MDEVWLATVKIARDCGDISSLFPAGIARLWDLPHTIFEAIRDALYYLSMRENAMEESEIPPKRIWRDDEKMTQWFKEVNEARVEKMRGDTPTRDMPQNAVIKDMFPGLTVG